MWGILVEIRVPVEYINGEEGYREKHSGELIHLRHRVDTLHLEKMLPSLLPTEGGPVWRWGWSGWISHGGRCPPFSRGGTSPHSTIIQSGWWGHFYDGHLQASYTGVASDI